MPFTKHGNETLIRAHDDEPIFVLRAQDESAAMFVRLWAGYNGRHLGFGHSKVKQALAVATAMDMYHTHKRPD